MKFSIRPSHHVAASVCAGVAIFSAGAAASDSVVDLLEPVVLTLANAELIGLNILFESSFTLDILRKNSMHTCVRAHACVRTC